MKISRTEARKLFIEYGWLILECKYKYYYPKKYGPSPLSDQEFDKIENTYKRLADFLKLPSTASDTVGFPLNSPSGRHIIGCGTFPMIQKYISKNRPKGRGKG